MRLNSPNKFTPVGQGAEIVDLGGKLRFEAKLTEDKDVKIKFSKK